MPAEIPLEWPDLTESLSSDEVTDARPEFGVYTGRRYVREYTILMSATRGRNLMKAECSVVIGHEGVRMKG
jgi:hypothetical protein